MLIIQSWGLTGAASQHHKADFQRIKTGPHGFSQFNQQNKLLQKLGLTCKILNPRHRTELSKRFDLVLSDKARRLPRMALPVIP